jgi:glutathione S-transferase
MAGNLYSYLYPYMVYHVVHESLVFPELGIAPDAAVIAHALPKCERALSVMEQDLSGDLPFIADDRPTLADYFLLPTLTALSFTTEGKQLLARFAGVRAWLARMGELTPVMEFRSTLPPRVPIEHARRWATDHRPRVG